jgi:CTP:molybdopterin cytidylyltransferase MocA
MPKQFFRALATFQGKTLRQFLAPLDVVQCEVGDPGLDLDIDRPSDYRRARRLAKAAEKEEAARVAARKARGAQPAASR